MGVFDGFTSILFRQDASGRRVYTPFGKWGGVYEVPDNDARRIQRDVKLFWIGWFVAVFVLQLALDWRYVFWAIPLMMVLFFVRSAWHIRRLRRLPLSPRDLPRLSRPELEQRYSRAVGTPTLAFLSITSIVFVVIGIWIVASGTGGALGWLVVLFFGLCSVSLFRQWRRARS